MLDVPSKGHASSMSKDFYVIHSGQLTWQWEIHRESKMYLLLQNGWFSIVSLPEGILGVYLLSKTYTVLIFEETFIRS